MLELIDKGSESETHTHPVVFVHGGWHAGWCWEENFLGFFVERGFRVLAPSLRGHGLSPAGKPLWMCTTCLSRQDGCMSEGQELPPIPAEFERFTPRTARALVRGGYRSLDDVQTASDAELLALRNFGFLSLAEVRAVGR